MHLVRRFLRTEKSHRHSRKYRAPSGPPQKTEKLSFFSKMQRLEAPRTWPNKAIKCGGHGSDSRGDRHGSRCDHGRTGSYRINGAQGQQANQTLAPPAGSYPPLRRARGPLSVP
jgi:hypothetical protein